MLFWRNLLSRYGCFPREIFSFEVMDTPEEVGLDARVFAGKAVEKPAEEDAAAFVLIRAVVGHRSDTGRFEPGFNHLFSEVIKRANDSQGTRKKGLGGQDGACRGGKEEIQEECFVGILKVVTERNLLAAKFGSGLKKRLTPFPGAEEAGVGFGFLELFRHRNIFDRAVQTQFCADALNPFGSPAGKAGVDVNRKELPVLVMTPVVFVEGKKQTEAVSTTRNTNHHSFVFLNQLMGNKRGTEQSFRRLHLIRRWQDDIRKLLKFLIEELLDFL